MNDELEEMENEEEEVELHTCPFQEEIHNDFTFLCACTDEQMYECYMDI